MNLLNIPSSASEVLEELYLNVFYQFFIQVKHRARAENQLYCGIQYTSCFSIHPHLLNICYHGITSIIILSALHEEMVIGFQILITVTYWGVYQFHLVLVNVQRGIVKKQADVRYSCASISRKVYPTNYYRYVLSCQFSYLCSFIIVCNIS